MKRRKVTLEYARLTLAKVWFGGCAVLFCLLIVQSFGTVYESHRPEVWSWALPTVMPTLSLIVAVLRSGAFEEGADKLAAKSVKPEFFATAFWLSVCYLALIIGSILATPMVR